MPRISTLTWLVGPILGLFTIVLTLWFTGKAIFHAASYAEVLPSVYFLAITVSSIGCAEAFELAFNFDKSKLGTNNAVYLMFCALINLFYLLFLCFAVGRILVAQQRHSFMIDNWDVLLSLAFVLVATLIGRIFKSNLEAVREAALEEAKG